MTAGTRLWVRTLLCLALYSGLVLGFVAAQDSGSERKNDSKKSSPPTPDFKLPDAFGKVAPASVEELRQIQEHVEKVLDKVLPSVVGIKVGMGQGSGVIISEDGLVLTAGHVSGTPNKKATVVLPNGKNLPATTLGQNKSIDSGMVKITEPGKYPALPMGHSSDLKKGQWVIAIGHPGGFRPNRTPVVRVGRILNVNGFLIQTDCTLVGGDSGGPLFDMQGRVIGIHSRIGGTAITENVHVPIDTFRQTFAKLEKGESWGLGLGQAAVVKGAGGKEVFKKTDKLTTDDETIPAPNDKNSKSYHKTYTFRMKAGSTYTIDLTAQNAKKKGKGKKKDNNNDAPVPSVLDPFLRLQSPDGKTLAEDDDGAGDMNSRIVFKALKDGDYKIIATSFDGEQTGSFTLTILEADYKDAIVSGKVDVLRAVKLPLPAVKILTEKTKDAKGAIVFFNAVVVNDKGDPVGDKEVTLNWEKGTEKLKSDNQGIIRWPLAKEKVKGLTMQLPGGTRAMLALTDKDGVSFPMKGAEDPSVEKIKSAGGPIVKTITGELKKSDPFDIERDKCVRHIHQFKMQTGKTYTIDLMSEDFDAYLRLEDAEGNKLAEDDDGAGFMNSRIVHTPKEDGTYRLVVTTCDPGQHGAYRVVIREIDAAPAKK